TNRYTQFNIGNAPSGTIVWNITNPLIPYSLNLTPSPSNLQFTDSTQNLQTYIAFTLAMAAKPLSLGTI
ncbi:hypothetical protein, partial [Klebsiella pneumoniae]|uniref:hypothetical protein n=1 Tax=Klebsiella pneumoniae TaxID=573 RepID=UPI0019549B98